MNCRSVGGCISEASSHGIDMNMKLVSQDLVSITNRQLWKVGLVFIFVYSEVPAFYVLIVIETTFLLILLTLW
jgi:hypothetical protein